MLYTLKSVMINEIWLCLILFLYFEGVSNYGGTITSCRFKLVWKMQQNN